MKYMLLTILMTLGLNSNLCAQQKYSGRVVNLEGHALKNATIMSLPDKMEWQTDDAGYFDFVGKQIQIIKISCIGYQSKTIKVGASTVFGNLVLETADNRLDEVIVNTGYYQMNKGNLTGSFTQVDQKLLSRNPSPNILDRLEGVTSGLQFDRSLSFGENEFPSSMRVRGVSSIESSVEPLIILDNFPFEGSLNSINPNDIESITVLKDASAAAIWGAKAGNGVIVLTSKKGKLGESLKITFNNSLKVGRKPDLYYNKQWLSAKEMMEVEEYLYSKGNYYPFDFMYMPDYAALRYQLDANVISETEFISRKERFAKQDIRSEALALLYQQQVLQQYAINLRGGSLNHMFFFSGGWDKERSNVIGNKNERLTFNFVNELKVTKNLTLNTELKFGSTRDIANGYTLQQLNANQSGISPYTTLLNDDGTYSSVNYQFGHTYRDQALSNGLLDWTFNPIVDRAHRDLGVTSKNLLMGLGLSYRWSKGLSVDFKYRYQGQWSQRKNLYGEHSYFSRNLINQYTQLDGVRIIPIGAIKEGGAITQAMQNARVQLNWLREWTSNHQLTAIAGAEISDNKQLADAAYRLYGFDDNNLTSQVALDYRTMYNLRPNGAARIPTASFNDYSITDRFISYFANASYLYNKKHGISASVRWDASNLFGVKTNQRGVPLWSVGFSEQLKPYLKDHAAWLSQLTLRTTYGFSGNVNNTISSLPSMRMEPLDFISGLPYANIKSAGNPNLRWEKLSTSNVGLDYALFSNRISGSIDYYVKKGRDLIGPNFLDPTHGIIAENGNYLIDNRINFANIETKGVDVVLNGKVIDKDFKWDVNLLWSWTSNKVTRYMANASNSVSEFVFNPQPREGYSKDALYAWPFAGLSAENGQILTPNKDQDYMNYILNAKLSDLKYMGVSFPPVQGSLRQTFSYKNFELSATMEWKNGFYFRRNSIDYFKLFFSGVGHSDYLDRWKQQGDEIQTTVPALPPSFDYFREGLYSNGAQLIEKGDFLRLSDLNFSYRLSPAKWGKLSMRTFIYVKNLGIIYRSNKVGIDPEAVNTVYPQPRTFTFGFQLEW
ncbi:SusC/RagA family TonB-linked outer membrane protein [Sphingobacterium sp. MYb388]|uniref:SusC/RagA family TonB-linked outer membrane protein n=1 Tax=Sphingobacterium sp. MYb388 TaxID=2745437 RepID=UPI0030A637B7